MTMQSSSAQVTVMESQDLKRAPAWTKWEVRDLLTIWGDESVLAELRSSNGKILEKVSKAMKDRGHNRVAQQCRVKIKELRQAYHKAREANGRSGAEPQTCRFYANLHAMLGGAATTTPSVCFDSINGESRNREAGSGYEEDDDEDNEDSSQQGSRETGFPNSQDMFITLDLKPVTPQGVLPDPEGTQGTSAANVSPLQRLVKIRRRKWRTRDDMFSELQMSSHADRAQQNAWRQSISECKKAQYEREERWRAESQAEESKWWAKEDRWRQLADRRQESMLRLLEHQTEMLQRMVELQERQQEQRPPLQSLCNQQSSSPSSIASSPRRPRTQWGGLRPRCHATPPQMIAQASEGWPSIRVKVLHCSVSFSFPPSPPLPGYLDSYPPSCVMS
ncbi:protein lin-52 homolog isoform X1 [Malaclemys terrapin pileata]|uniref:protein lin-52 homolog isoform X1 n=1 Tax=Malaclemys terrapin pileata TaxID=2991368 RepID=UPI0023A8C399|nr:protein lin-52 homolog isoform X1 [Malaclemys terrapin pileata]